MYYYLTISKKFMLFIIYFSSVCCLVNTVTIYFYSFNKEYYWGKNFIVSFNLLLLSARPFQLCQCVPQNSTISIISYELIQSNKLHRNFMGWKVQYNISRFFKLISTIMPSFIQRKNSFNNLSPFSSFANEKCSRKRFVLRTTLLCCTSFHHIF